MRSPSSFSGRACNARFSASGEDRRGGDNQSEVDDKGEQVGHLVAPVMPARRVPSKLI